VRYADDGVVLCRSAAQVRVALEAIRGILAGLGAGAAPGQDEVSGPARRPGGTGLPGLPFQGRACQGGCGSRGGLPGTAGPPSGR
jgi:RNA-directed DNA polymerase